MEKGRGRRSTPPQLRLLEGRTRGHDSGGRPVPTPAPFVREGPEKPAGLSRHASDLWDYVIEYFGPMKLLKGLDGPPLEVMAETWARYQEAKAMRIRTGQVIKVNRSGDEVLVAAPWAKLEAQAARDLRSWFAEFAMGPVNEIILAKSGKDDEGESNPFAGAV